MKIKFQNILSGDSVQTTLTIPCGSVKSERSISVLFKIHNYNRTTKGIGTLGDLSLLALESELINSIPKNKVIDYFEDMKSPKLVLH